MSSPSDRSPSAGGPAWQQHRERKLTLGLEATPVQRLAWLEEMIAVLAGSLG